MTAGSGAPTERELFVDTSAWYPIVVSDHPQHARLAGALRARVEHGVKVVTTSLILAETHALLLRRVSRDVALRFAETVAQPPNDIVPCSAELETMARTQWLTRFADQRFSLADGVSFAVMTQRGITQALTLDQHFATAGFVMV